MKEIATDGAWVHHCGGLTVDTVETAICLFVLGVGIRVRVVKGKVDVERSELLELCQGVYKGGN